MQKLVLKVLLLYVVLAADTQGAITKSMTLKPKTPTDSWTVTLPLYVSAHLTISIEKREKVGDVDYELRKQASGKWFDMDTTPKNQDFLWTGELINTANAFTGTVSVLNTGKGAPSTTVKVACTWKPKPGIGTAGPGTGPATVPAVPNEIEGLAIGTAMRTSSAVSWEFDRTVQAAGVANEKISWTVRVYDNVGTPVNVQFTGMTAANLNPSTAWTISPPSPPTGSETTWSGTVASESGSTGNLRVTFTGADGSPNTSEQMLTFLRTSVELVGAPADGLVVKRGDTVTMKVNIEPTAYAPPTGEPKWFYQRLKSDGKWEPWTSFGTTANGKTYTHTTTMSGVFQVKAVLSVEGMVVCEAIYVRANDEAHSLAKAGEPDAFGVADTQIQIDIRTRARAFLGNTDYEGSDEVPAQYGFPAFPAFENKCNIFVAHRAAEAGAVVPLIAGRLLTYPPIANQWAGQDDTNPILLLTQTAIVGWPLFRHPTYPQPGDIVGRPNPNGSGHVGIVDYDGVGIATGSRAGKIIKMYPPFLDGTSGFRRYTP